MPALYLTKDLFFASRVTATARALGGEVCIVGSGEKLIEQFAENCRLVLIDLDAPVADISSVVSTLRERSGDSLAVIAFGSHVHEARLEAARQAGCDAVLTRGQFDRQMAEFLKGRLD
jgi:CheY-like chemotaxis protein